MSAERRMALTSQHLAFEKIARLGSLFQCLLGITVEESWILAFIFHQGGFTTRNMIFRTLELTSMTYSPFLDKLTEREFIQQNKEFSPYHITLTLKLKQLRDKLAANDALFQSDASPDVAFLSELDTISPKFVLRNAANQELLAECQRSLRTLLMYIEQADVLVELLSLCYIDYELREQTVSFSEFYAELSKNKNKCESYLSDPEELREMMLRSSLVETFTRRVPPPQGASPKAKKRDELFIRPRFSLSLMANYLFARAQAQHETYKMLLAELHHLTAQRQQPPRENLSSFQSLKRRLDACLGVYQSIRIIDNGIYFNRTGRRLLDLIRTRKNFTSQHTIRVLSNQQNFSIPSALQHQIKVRPLPEDVSRDQQERDKILFDLGGLIVPSNPAIDPYYLITPDVIRSAIETFEALWRE